MKKIITFLLTLVLSMAGSAALAAPATQFKITAAATATAGTAITVTVQAVDANQAVDTAFAGTANLNSTDLVAQFSPASLTFAAADAGSKTVSVTFLTAGNQTITASGLVNGTLLRGTSSAVAVSGGSAATLTVTAPSSAGTSAPFNVTVAAKDSFGNAATSYAGTVKFTSTDASAVLPADTKLANGTATVSVTLKTVGKQTVTATDTTASSIKGTSNEITVSATPAQLTLSPTSLDFGGQSMRTTSPALAITLTNSGGATTSVTSITASSNYSVSHDCATVNPGSFCTANVRFTPLSEGTIGGTLTIVSGAGTQTASLTGVGEKSLVTHYYRSILRRAPDAGGKTFWNTEATRVQALGLNVNEVWFAMAGSFYFSQEYVNFKRSDADYVTDLYNTFFNRAPDTTGFNDWTSRLAQGMPREVVLAEFMFSSEFTTFTQSIFGTASVRPEIDMVTDFYRGVLGRLPDDGGFNAWLLQMRTGQCQGATQIGATVEQISSQFAQSGEYAARGRTDAQYVGDLYNGFLRRGGDLAGVKFWIDEISSKRRTREDVRKLFVTAPEFAARVNAVVGAGCFSAPNDKDINGRDIPSPTGPVGARMCEEFGPPSPGGGPGPCGSYEIPIGNCSSGMTGADAINRAFLYALEDYTPTSPRLGNSIRFGLQRDFAMVFRMKTGPISAFPNTLGRGLQQVLGFSYEEYTSLGPFYPRFVTLSESKCDFDYNKTLAAGALNGCFRTMDLGGSLLATLTTTGADASVTFPSCQLKPNTVYYLNIRYEDATTVAKRGKISCPASPGRCGQTIGLN